MASIPLALFVHEGVTTPKGDVKGLTILASTLPDDYQPLATNRATRLGEVIAIWTALQHFFPHFDVANTEWDTVLPQVLGEAAVAEDEIDYGVVLERIMAPLNDSHAYAIGMPATVRDTLARVPIELAWVEEQVIVTGVFTEGTPISNGDVLIAIDGRPIQEVVTEMEARTSGSTDMFRRRMALQKPLYGAKDTPIELTLRSATNGEYTVTLRYNQSNPEWYQRVTLIHEALEPISEVAPDIYYISMGRLDLNLLRSMEAELEMAKGIIIDMREYPAQVSWGTKLMLMPELMNGPLFSTPIIRFPNQEQWEYPPPDIYFDGGTPIQVPKVYLIDDRTLSQGEHWVSMIQHNQNAEDPAQEWFPLVGERTAGSNGEPVAYRSPSGYALQWTGKKAYRPDGVDFQGNGVEPDYEVSPTIQGIAEGRDEVLDFAIHLLQGE